MQAHFNTYQGMNKDMAADSMPNSLYLDAVDIRITTTVGDSMGAWTNIKGNKQSFTISSNSINAFPTGQPFGAWTASNPEIIGYTVIRDRIIVFVADDTGTKGWIYDIQYNPATRDILSGFPVLLYYNANLNFKKEWPIEALGRYESGCVQRVYWTDYNNFFRSLNLEDTDLATFPVGQVDIYPDIEYTQPILTFITGGGALLSGEYQPTYRLSTSDGKQTLISPPGNLIHVVADSESMGQSAQYTGDAVQVNTGKSLSIKIDTSNYGDFDKIELIIAYYPTLNGTPEVKTIEQTSINGQSEITFVYTGTEGSAFPIELFDFISKNFTFKTPKTITQKDSSLVIANIKGSEVSLSALLAPGETFDSRTGRYNSLGVLPHVGGTEIDKLKNTFNISTDADPDRGYNSDAHWYDTWHTSAYQHKYKLNGTTLGGEGPNIKYNFHLEPFSLNGDVQPGFANVSNLPTFEAFDNHDLGHGYGVYPNTTYPNLASPFLSGLLRGYKRGETYRFGIIFYTKKGEATFVEPIGDIKFPDISDVNDVDTINDALFSGIKYFPTALTGSTATYVVAFALGIEFEIDFTTCPSLLNQIESYQFVRVKREMTDTRRVSQGLIKTFWYAPTGGAGSDFDLDINGDLSVLHLPPYYPEGGAPEAASPGSLNATFRMLEDHELYTGPMVTPFGVNIFNDYLIKGQYLGFYSPEISYNFNNVDDFGTSLSNSPCLLLTGAYNLYDRTLISDQDFTAEGLGISVRDYRNSLRQSFPVDFHSIENIKIWKNIKKQEMPDTITYVDAVTPKYDSYYMRNYYAIDNFTDITAALNDPNPGAPPNTLSQFYRAGTSLIGQMNSISTDPLLGTPVTPSATTYFDPVDISILDKTTLIADAALSNTCTPIMDLVLPKREVYGGYNQSALEANIFIAASPVIDKTIVSEVKVFGGDIFINMFTLQTGMVELDPAFFKLTLGNPKYYAQTNSTTQIFPVETVINIDLDHGATLKRDVKYTHQSLEQVQFRQETGNSSTLYGKVNNMYAYNSVYSREGKDVTFFIEPDTAKECRVNDIRAYLSNVKLNEETIDSWTKFGINNYYDIDDYGPINKILNHKDNIFFFQDRAVGVYAINRAAITTTNDGVPTQLGTGEGFGKHQYYTKVHGAIHQWGVKATDTGVYFFDGIHRKFFMIGGQGNNPISEIKGIHSFLQKLPSGVFIRKENGGDNPILRKGITIGKDSINDEVIFTFLGTGNFVLLTINTSYIVGTVVYSVERDGYRLVTESFDSGIDIETAYLDLVSNSILATDTDAFKDDSIVYDELAQQFSSRYSSSPKIWIENGDILISCDPNQSEEGYTHNIGNWGEFYGVVEESSIKLILNPAADVNKVLRTLEFNSILRDGNKVVDRTKTITGFQIENEYQTTGIIPFSATRIKRRFDKWRVKIPRDQNSTNQRARLRSSYFILTLYFDNTENKEFIMNKLISYYDAQIF